VKRKNKLKTFRAPTLYACHFLREGEGRKEGKEEREKKVKKKQRPKKKERKAANSVATTIFGEGRGGERRKESCVRNTRCHDSSTAKLLFNYLLEGKGGGKYVVLFFWKHMWKKGRKGGRGRGEK